jgi:carboxymethylenebutenolidase
MRAMDLGHSSWRASDGADLAIYHAAGEGSSLPGLVVFPSIFGVTGELSEHADVLAAEGALVVAFDPFSRLGDQAGPRDQDQVSQAMSRLQDLDFERANRDFRELVAALADDPRSSGEVVGLGICMGGAFIMNAAADGLLAGAACWHGSRLSNYLDRVADIRCPFELDFGNEDPVVPPDQLEAIVKAFADAPNVTIRIHEGAGHGFSHTGWRAYRADAAAAGRAAVGRLLARLRGQRV